MSKTAKKLDKFVHPDFVGKDNDGRPRSDYLAKIAGMDDAALLKETEDKIWLSAYAANNRRSDFHWHVTALYAEWHRRGKVDQYEVAFKRACEKA